MCNLVVIAWQVRIRRIWNTKSESSGFIRIQRILILADSVTSIVRHHCVSSDHLPPDCWWRDYSKVALAVHAYIWLFTFGSCGLFLQSYPGGTGILKVGHVLVWLLVFCLTGSRWTVCTMHCVVCCSSLRTFTLVVVLTNVWLRRVSENKMLFFLLRTNFIHRKWIL